MTKLMQSMWQISTLWHEAGASASVGFQAALELLAAFKRSDFVQHDRDGLHSAPLSLIAWAKVRAQLSKELELPGDDGSPERFYDTRPQLLDATARLVREWVFYLSSPDSQELTEALVEYLRRVSQADGRRGDIGHFGGPDYLPTLIGELIGKPGKDAVYIPFDSSGWLPLVLAKAGWKVSSEVQSHHIARTLKLIAYICNLPLTVRVSDALRSPSWRQGEKLRRFPASAAIASFGLRLKDQGEHDPYDRFPVRMLYGEVRQLAHLVAQTEGRVLCVIQDSFLFRAAGGERDYKEHLVRRGLLSAVVRLPKQAFAPFANIQTSLLVLDTLQSRTAPVLFVDGSDDLGKKSASRSQSGMRDAVSQIIHIIGTRRPGPHSAVATYDEIAANDFNLSVDRYVRSEDDVQIARVLESERTVELADIADIIRPQSFAGDGTEHTQRFAEVGLQDVQPGGIINQPTKIVEIDDRNLGRILRQQLSPGDVLLSVRGRIGAVGIVPNLKPSDEAAGWLASQAFVVLRLRETAPLRPLALYRYLASQLGQGILQSLSSGATVPMVSMGDVKKLRIIVPTPEEQRRIEMDYRETTAIREQIAMLEKRFQELLSHSWPMTRMPK